MAEIQTIPSDAFIGDVNPNWRAPVGPRGAQDSNSIDVNGALMVMSADQIGGVGVYTFVSLTPSAALAGGAQFTFLNDWYDRFHVVPTVIDYGTFAEDKEGSTTIWNAFLTAQVLSSAVAGSGTQGVTYTAPVLPSTFQALQTKSLTFTALGEGTPTILESFTLTFDSGATTTVGMIGVRLDPPEGILFDDAEPQWSDSVTIVEEWRTSIITSEEGDEQREALRTFPRKRIQFAAVISPTKLKAFRQRVSTLAHGNFYVADQTRWTTLTAPSGPLDIVLNVDEIPTWAQAGQWVIVRYQGRKSIRQVYDTSESNGQIIFLEGDDETWPVGARLHPAFNVEFDDATPTVRETRQVVTVRFDFPVIPGTELDEDYGVAELIFDGREVMTLPVNWADGEGQELLRPSDLIDFMTGVQDRTFPITNPAELTDLPFLGFDHETSHAFRCFFHRHKGRQKEFYLSTGEPDLTVAFPLVNAENILFVEDADDLTAYATNETRRAIEVKLTDGTLIHRVVESIAAAEDSNSGVLTQLVLTQGWPSTIPVASIERVSWLTLCRFASDIISMEWLNNEVGRTRLVAQTLKWVAAEA